MDIAPSQKLYALFSRLVNFSENALADIERYFAFKTFQPKENIFCAGEHVSKVFFAIDGVGRYFYIDEQGIEKNKSLVAAGGAFASVSSLVDGSPSPFYTQAITPCSTAAISYEQLITLARVHPDWAEFLRKVYERLVIKKEKREAGLLLLDAKERYVQFLREFPEQSKDIPLRHIAMYIGVTDVTLSRIRREMGLT